MAQAVLLINTNVAQPPVSPVGLEYVGEALTQAGVPVHVLDLSFEADWKAAVRSELRDHEPLLVGLPVRNTDDCSFASRRSFLPWIAEVVTEVRKLTGAPIFLGGTGFSTMPETVLRATQADAGIEGDGEAAVLALANCQAIRREFIRLPNMVYWRNKDVMRTPRADVDLGYLPTPHRRIFDNRRYEQLGAMVGIETKRGCSQKCIFCADPVAKGRRVRLRPPGIVVQEAQGLVDQGVSWLHICDSEFNLPIEHAKAVCRAIIQGGIGNRIRWYCYCSPSHFDQELASLMKSAGCAGINFGVDSLCDEQLHRLGRTHRARDVYLLVELLRKQGLNYMFDLLIGGPGETPETATMTIERAKQLDVPLVGIATGVRVYPDTALAKCISHGSIKGGLHPDKGRLLHEPLFYLSPPLGNQASALIKELTAGDSRFLALLRPAEKGSYNYADDDILCQLIESGGRGAYWDIIRRSQGG
jgi:radical SAM superfamily enzyme YgiQ (UPF0313 family)